VNAKQAVASTGRQMEYFMGVSFVLASMDYLTKPVAGRLTGFLNE
jgi:hypothetical protein